MPRRSKQPSIPVALGFVLVLAASIGAGGVIASAVGADAPAGKIPTAPNTIVNPGPLTKTYSRMSEYAVFNKYCVQCHVSVADPERPGKTRDEWYRIVNLMHEQGLVLTQDEADMIVDLLFKLRRGIEDQAG